MSYSNSLKPLKLENILDPRLNCMNYAQSRMKWAIEKNGEGVNHVQQQCNSYSSAGITWNFNTQSDNVIIDRRMYARVQFQYTVTGISPIGQPLLNTESDAPRAFPLGSVTNSCKVTLNGTSMEVQYADSLEGMMRYNAEHDLFNYDLSGTPNVLDNAQRYQDMVGGIRNPLSGIENNSYEFGRGCFKMDSIVNPVSADGVTPTTSTVTFTVVEPIFVSPLLYSATDLQSGLIGIKNVGVQFSFKSGQLDRLWSHALNAGVTITSSTASLGQGVTTTPELLVTYITPPLIDMGKIPDQINYQYYKVDTYINDQSSTLASGASQSYTNNAIQLSTVPKSIYIWGSLPNASKTFETTDTFFRINSLSLNYLNVSGQFSSMNEPDLYNMCVKNGLKLNWVEFHGETTDITSSSNIGLCGAVLRIDCSDLNLPSNVASGMNINSQLSFTINLTNVSPDSKAVQLNTVMVYDGLFTIDRQNGTCNTQIGVIDEQDVLQTRLTGEYVDWNSAKSLYGGNFFSKMGHFAKDMFKTTKHALKETIPLVRDVLELKRLTGLGYDEEYGGADVGGAIVGGSREPKYIPRCVKVPEKKKPKKSAKKGGALVGGRMLSRDELRDRLFD